MLFYCQLILYSQALDGVCTEHVDFLFLPLVPKRYGMAAFTLY